MAVLIQINRAGGYLVTERAASLDTSVVGGFIYNFTFELVRQDLGKIFITPLINAGVTATIDSSITSSDSSIAITVASGTVPDTGYCKIGSELMRYTYSSPTVTFGERGAFITTAAAAASGATIVFSQTKETCTPYYEYIVRNSNQI